jgi:AraC-like DNA-binding protein
MVDHSSGSERPLPDSVSEVLQELRLARAFYGRYEMSGPWGFAVPPGSGARFHLVLEGGYWLRPRRSAPQQVGVGDVVLLPHGTGHVLADPATGRAPPARLPRLDDLPLEQVGSATYRQRVPGPGPRSLAVCCVIDFDDAGGHPLLELLPDVLLLRGGAAADPALSRLLEAMAEEAGAHRLGEATVLTRLADGVVTRVVRAWAEGRAEETTGWLAAIRDPEIGRAMVAIHRRPGEPWSVESLAGLAHLSRSTFSERFAAAVGEPPARYLARWRMHLAGGWLRRDRRTVAEVAARLGYESEASFSRAFKRLRGVPPGAVRQGAWEA